jgi:hypothetical protein
MSNKWRRYVSGASLAPVSMYLEEPPATAAITFRDTDTLTFTAGPNRDFQRFMRTGQSDVHTLRGAGERD